MNLLADTCFWISLCDPTESNHSEAISMMETILATRTHTLLVPHPVLYETLRTEMVKKPERVLILTKYIEQVVKVPDGDYIDEAFHLVEQQAIMRNGTASMVDIVIKLMADDLRNNVKGIITRNGRDFSAFCQKRKIPMVENKNILESI